MRWQRSTWWITVALLVAGLCLRVLLFHLRPPISGDALIYGDIATNMLQHKMYALTVDGALKPTLIRLPGYPSFVALCFALFGKSNFLSVVCAQVFLDLANCCLLGAFAARLLGVRTGLWALGFSALCPLTANYSVVPLTETLSLLCVTSSFFAFERWCACSMRGDRWSRWLAVLALTVAFAVLLRPDRALLCAVLVPAMVWVSFRRREGSIARRVAPAAIVVAVFTVPLLLWGLRNWRVFHVVQPLAPKYANDPGEEVAVGFMRWYRTWGSDYQDTVQVYWTYDGSFVDFRDIPDRAFDTPEQRLQTQRLITAYNNETASTSPIDVAFAALAQERISAHPVRYYVLLPAARLADMWLRPRTELLKMPLHWWHWRVHPGKTAVSLAYALLNAAYLVLAALGIRRWKRTAYGGQPVLAWAMFAFVLLRSLLLATIDNAEQRYTIDCFPIVLLLASFACTKFTTDAGRGSPTC